MPAIIPEKESIRFDGRHLPALTGIALMNKLQENFVCFLLALTEKKRALEDLRKSQEEYRTILRNFPNGSVFLFDRDLRYLIAEGEGLAAAGLSREMLEGKTIWEALPAKKSATIEPMYRAALAGEATFQEIPYAGLIYAVWVLPVKNDLGEIFAGMAMAQDITGRVRAEEERARLLAEERKARAEAEAAQRQITSIMERISDGFFALNRQWRFTYINPQAMQVLQRVGRARKREALTGSCIWEVFPETVRSKFFRECRRAVTEQVAVEFEEFYPQLNLWLEVHAYPDRDGLSVYLKDITERVRAEQALKFQADILTQVSDAVIAIDSEERITYWNKAAELLYNFSAGDVIGKPLQESHQYCWIDPSDERAAHEALATTGCWQGENIHIKKTGEKIYVESSVSQLKDEGGNVTGMVAAIRDITDRKRERALLAGQNRILELIATGVEIPEVLNFLARFIESQSEEAFCCIMLPEPNGKNLQCVAAPSLPESFARGADRLALAAGAYSWGGAEYSIESAIALDIGADPLWRDCRDLALAHGMQAGWSVPVRDAGGEIAGVLAVYCAGERQLSAQEWKLLEISARLAGIAIERQRTFCRLQQYAEELEKANRMKDEFLSTVSHELRTPLNAILGWTQLLLSRNFDETARKRALLTIERNAKSQVKVVEDILNVSRIVQGNFRLSARRLNPVRAIYAALDVVRPAAEAKNIRLVGDLDPSVGEVLADGDRLQQVVWNLLSNAVKFTPALGTVFIRLSAEMGHPAPGTENGTSGIEQNNQSPIQNPKSQIQNPKSSSAQIPIPCAQIQVRDTGTGIDPEFLPFVFDRFSQADSSTTRVKGGLGLGLAIVRHLVELHGGEVRAESGGIGQGATFTVRLPLLQSGGDLQPLSLEPPPLRPPNPKPLSGLRIVVVDDEAEICDLFAAILEQHGAEVRAVLSAADALSAIKKVKPDLLIADIAMPGEDGYTLLRKLRALESERGGFVPAIALTAYASKEDGKRALATGFQLHLPKPAEPDELVAAVASLAKPNG
ncbi:PAS domain-containing protein [Kamptonema formosum]|uniref:PAS domain-containing protein n=1 Tax=Kamptonema formosum TaxID=331992 RepID=UPI0003462D53|nr:PAS domain-containing protein [Oscillatoria sp. PCC 10802]